MRLAKNRLIDYNAPQPRWFERFLWWCAGADERIMVKTTYYDYVKYSCIGGLVLGTGLMAALSMGFAIDIIFKNTIAAILIGVFWGMLIFNLDRFVVSSTGKGDGKSTISWGEFWHASPRLVMALLIGLTISAPLEIYIFNKEIKKNFYLQNEDLAKGKLQEVYDGYEMKTINDMVDNLKKQIESHESSRVKFLALAADENKTEHGGCGPKCNEFKRLANDESELLKSKSEKYAKAVRKRESFIRSAKTNIINSLSESPGLLESLIVLHQIPGAKVPVWLLRLLFVFVELSPVFFKLMLVFSGYDFLEENAKQIVLMKQGISLKNGYFNKKPEENMLNYAEFTQARDLQREMQEKVSNDRTINASIFHNLFKKEIKEINDSMDT